MIVTEYGKSDVRSEDYALMVGEALLKLERAKTSGPDAYHTLEVYTAMRLCNDPTKFIGCKDDAELLPIIEENCSLISSAIAHAIELLDRRKDLQDKLVGLTCPDCGERTSWGLGS